MKSKEGLWGIAGIAVGAGIARAMKAAKPEVPSAEHAVIAERFDFWAAARGSTELNLQPRELVYSYGTMSFWVFGAEPAMIAGLMIIYPQFSAIYPTNWEMELRRFHSGAVRLEYDGIVIQEWPESPLLYPTADQNYYVFGIGQV